MLIKSLNTMHLVWFGLVGFNGAQTRYSNIAPGHAFGSITDSVWSHTNNQNVSNVINVEHFPADCI